MSVNVRYIGKQGANEILIKGNLEQINLPKSVTVE